MKIKIKCMENPEDDMEVEELDEGMTSPECVGRLNFFCQGEGGQVSVTLNDNKEVELLQLLKSRAGEL